MTSNPSMSPSSEASVLQARDITLRFGGVTALAEVAIDVRDNELLAIIGPNGAGKSSLMNVLSGFYQPQQGSVHYRGQDIKGRAVHQIAAHDRTVGVDEVTENQAREDVALVARPASPLATWRR